MTEQLLTSARENKESFLNYLRGENVLQDEAVLDQRMQEIPEHSRRILEDRWGLNGSTICRTFQEFGERFEVPLPRMTYDRAEADLRNAALYETISDRDKMSWEMAVGFGRLKSVLGGNVKSPISSSELQEIVESLPQEEKIFVNSRFGLDGKGRRTLSQIAEELGIPEEKITRREIEILSKLMKEI